MGNSLIEMINSKTKHPEEVQFAQKLFVHMTHSVLLQVNERAKLEGNNDPLVDILSRARVGSITRDDIDQLNTRLVNTLEKAMTTCHPSAIFITGTHKQIAKINDEFRRLMVKAGGTVHRLVSKHVPKGTGHCLAADDLPIQQRRALYGVAGTITYYYVAVYCVAVTTWHHYVAATTMSLCPIGCPCLPMSLPPCRCHHYVA